MLQVLTALHPKYFKHHPDHSDLGKSLSISSPMQLSFARALRFFSSVLTTSCLCSPHPVIHLPHFIYPISWAQTSDHDMFLPECRSMRLMTAPVDSISPGSKLPFQPHFPLGSFLAMHYSHLRFWAFPTDAVHFYATSCSFFSSCSAPTPLSRPSPSPVTLPKSIGKQSLPLLSFHSTSWYVIYFSL